MSFTDTYFYAFTETLDRVRVAFLKVTLSNSVLRSIFCCRAYRLFFLFSLATFSSLLLALLFPLWVLALGPLIYGFPHLLASIRYVQLSVAEEDTQAPTPELTRNIQGHSFRFYSAVFACVAVVRILTDFGVWSDNGLAGKPLELEVISMGITFLGCAYLNRKSLSRILLGCLISIPICFAAWTLPLWTAGFLILFHNLVAFIYWISATKTSPERQVALLATAIFIILSAFLLGGHFDFIYPYFTPAAELKWADINYPQIGKMIAPWSKDYRVWFHCGVAYAFGQSLHYFVWLKAIPDQRHRAETPTSFRQSYKLLTEDVGRKTLVVTALASLALPLVWIFFKYPNARTLYFAVASYHGFLELGGLSLIQFRPRWL